MNLFSNEQLESLIEQASSIESPQSEEHRYALRRELLNAKYFEANKQRTSRFAFWFAPVLVSGFAVAGLVMVFHASSNTAPLPSISLPIASREEENNKISNEDLVATFFDDRPMVPMNRFENSIPVSIVSSRANLD